MIGKIFRAFSNDWKKFSAQGRAREAQEENAKNAKAGGGRGVGGMREEGSYKNISNAAARTWIAVGTRAGCLRRRLETNVLLRSMAPEFPLVHGAVGSSQVWAASWPFSKVSLQV